MRSIPDIVQINIYGLTLNELLKKNINIPYILSQHGITECVVFDVLRNNHISEMNSTDFSISSLNVPERNLPDRNQETMDIIVKEEVQEFHQHRPAVVCSSPAFPKYKDLLLNCSYSSIYYDGILQNDMAMFDNMDILDLSSIIEEESDNSEMEEFHSVREDDSLPLPTNSVQDLLNEILEKVENEQNLSKSKVESIFKSECYYSAEYDHFEDAEEISINSDEQISTAVIEKGDNGQVESISESECYYSADYDHFEDAEEINIASDGQISTAVIENNDRSFKKNLECITELLNELLDKVIAEMSNNEIYIEEEEFYMAEDDFDIFGGEFELIDYGNMINEEQHNILQVESDYNETLIKENPSKNSEKVVDIIVERNLAQKCKRKSSGKDISNAKVPKNEHIDVRNKELIGVADEGFSIINKDGIRVQLTRGNTRNTKTTKKSASTESKKLYCCYKDCRTSITMKYGYGRDRLVNHARTHMKKRKNTYSCHLCGFSASRDVTIRAHHKKEHNGELWKGVKKSDTPESFKELVEIFRACFPGWDAKLRVDIVTGDFLPDTIPHNKYLGIETFFNYNKTMQLASKRSKIE